MKPTYEELYITFYNAMKVSPLLLKNSNGVPWLDEDLDRYAHKQAVQALAELNGDRYDA